MGVERFGALSRAVSKATGTDPAGEAVEGIFATREVAEAVASELRDVFPDGTITIADEGPSLEVVGSPVERRRGVRLTIRRGSREAG